MMNPFKPKPRSTTSQKTAETNDEGANRTLKTDDEGANRTQKTYDEVDSIQTQLCKFYGSVIKENFVFSEDIVPALKAVLVSRKDVSEIQCNSIAYMLACMLRFGVHDACLSIMKFDESAMECEKIINKLCGKESIKVCCLGIESLFSAIGICKVIDELALPYKFFGEYIEVQLYLIDKKRGFKSLCQNLVSSANTLYKNIKLQKLNYVYSDLEENWMRDTLLGVSKSHIVVMSRYLSRSSFKKLKEFLQKTTDEMKKFAFLLYLDDIGEGHHDTLEDVMSKSSFSKLRSCKLNYKSLANLHRKHYGLQLPFFWVHESSPVRCSVWVKYSGIQVQPATNNTDEFIFPETLSRSGIKSTVKPKQVPTVLSKPRIGLKSTKSAIRSKNDRHKQYAKRTAASRYAIKSDDEY